MENFHQNHKNIIHFDGEEYQVDKKGIVISRLWGKNNVEKRKGKQ